MYMSHFVKRIATSRARIPVVAEKFVYPNTDHVFAGIPAFNDLADYPRPVHWFRADKHHHTALAVHFVIDPFFDRGLALPLDLFPRIRGAKRLPFKSTDVAHLLGAPKIVREVETEENAPRHKAPFCSPAF